MSAQRDPCTERLLAHTAMPDVARALRTRLDRCVRRWDQAVREGLPDAEPLTRKQVRDTIPIVLQHLADALESDDPKQTRVLEETTHAHGVTRFHQAFNVRELIFEYRLLRCIVVDELAAELGPALTSSEVLAVDSGVDIALQQAVLAFTAYQHEQLRATTESQARYLSFLSHDMRNNLNGVTLMLEVLRRRLTPLPDFAEDIEEIGVLQRAVEDTVNGMDQLLQAERLRRHAVEGKIAPTNLSTLARDIAAPFEQRAQHKGVDVAIDVAGDMVANVNRELVTLILQNLLGNAVKYSTSGTVRVTAERGPNDTWVVAVADEGPGIQQDELKKLFDAFKRGATHGEAGVGLGLSIASQAARLLGTDLHVESTVGRGSRFSFTLPAVDSSA